jgi:hypothetical protein
MSNNEIIQVIHEGKNTGGHQCVFVHKINKESPDIIRICQLCGRIEKIITPSTKTTFDDVYSKFYSKEGEK